MTIIPTQGEQPMIDDLQRVLYTDVRTVLVETDPAGVTRFVIEQESGTTRFDLRGNVMTFDAGHTVTDELAAWEQEQHPIY